MQKIDEYKHTCVYAFIAIPYKIHSNVQVKLMDKKSTKDLMQVFGMNKAIDQLAGTNRVELIMVWTCIEKGVEYLSEKGI